MKQKINEILRVDHAGESAAKQIYKGQLKILDNNVAAKELRHMLEQEEKHLEFFDAQLRLRSMKPSKLLPFWNAAGYCLGIVSAMIGKNAAMRCTDVVEDVISEHYLEQINDLNSLCGEKESDLICNIKKIRCEELEHQDLARESFVKSNVVLNVFSVIVKCGCKIAIKIAKKI